MSDDKAMNPPELIALYSTSIGTAVALITWAVALFITRAAAAREARRQLVSRFLDTIDELVKQQARPVYLALWDRKELDITLLQSRLSLELQKKDLPIGLWVWAQVQRILVAPNEKEVTRRALLIASSLTLWHRGDRKQAWFRDELRNEPIIEPFEIPKAAKRRLSGRTAKETFWGSVILGAFAFMIKQAIS